MKFITSEQLRIVLAMLAGVLTVIAFAGVFDFNQVVSSNESPVTIVTPTVYLTETTIPVLVSGVVKASDNTIIYAQTAGQIISLPAREGSVVTAGELLSKQASPVLDAQLAVLSAQSELSNLQQSVEVSVTTSLLKQSNLRTYSATEIAILRQTANDKRVAEATDSLLTTLQSSILTATAAINYVNHNRPLFTAEGLTLYDQVVADLYGQIPNYFHSGVTKSVGDQADLIAIINELQTNQSDSPVMVEEVSGLVLQQLQILSYLFTTAESDVFDRQSTFITAQMQTDYLNMRTDIVTAEQSLKQMQSGLEVTLDSLLEDGVFQTSGVAVTKVDEEIAATRAKYTQLISSQTERLRQMQTAVVVAQRSLGDVHAPFAGVVSKIKVDVGQYVTAGTPLLTLVGSGAQELEVTVPAGILSQLAVGQNFMVDGVLTGIVSRFSRVTNVGGGTVVISLTTPTGLTIGSSLMGNIMVDNTTESVYGVPRAYIHFDNDGPYIKYDTDTIARVKVVYDNGQMLFVEVDDVQHIPLVAATSITLK